MGEMVFLGEYTWKEIERVVKSADCCIVPFGSFEQHGPHLPLNTDSLLAAGILQTFSEYIQTANIPLNLVSLPVFPFGMSQEHLGFNGTISLPKESFTGYVETSVERLSAFGAKNIVLFNCNSGNTPYLQTAIKDIRAKTGIISVLLDIYSTDTIKWMSETLDYHAGKIETSLMLCLYSEKVRPKEMFPGDWAADENKLKLASLGFPWQSSDFSESGVIGDPGKADVATGQQVLEELLQEILRILTVIKEMT